MKLFTRGPRDVWFCLPVIFCMLLDAAFTLGCQPSGYWTDPTHVVEGNAAWEPLLRRGPGTFLAGFLSYCAVMTVVLVCLRGGLQKLLGMFLMLCHSYGVATWCHMTLPERFYWYGLLGVLLLEAAVYAFSRHLSGARRQNSE